MQKLISIYIDVSGYDRKGGLRLSNSDLHGAVQEHLDEYLSDGWKIVHLNCLPGPESGGWVIVAIEKDLSE